MRAGSSGSDGSEFIDRYNVRVVQAGEQPGLALEAAGEGGVGSERLRQEFQRGEAVELWLPHFVHRTHPTATDERHDLELRECRCDLLQRRRRGARGRVLRGCCRAGHKTSRAESLRGSGRERRAAFGTMVLGHDGVHTAS